MLCIASRAPKGYLVLELCHVRWCDADFLPEFQSVGIDISGFNGIGTSAQLVAVLDVPVQFMQVARAVRFEYVQVLIVARRIEQLQELSVQGDVQKKSCFGTLSIELRRLVEILQAEVVRGSPHC